MLNAVFGIGVEGVGHHRPVGDAAKGQGRDELCGAITHDGIDQGPGLHQFAGQVQRLVAGDTAGDAQDYVFTRQ